MDKTPAQIRIEIRELNHELKMVLAEPRGSKKIRPNRWIRMRELEWRIKALQAKLEMFEN